jgi:fission 1 protein
MMRLSWALVHSRQTDDVNRGIGMIEGQISYLFAWLKIYLLQHYHLTFTMYSAQLCFDQLICSAASLDKSTSPLQTREKLYLLAVGHFRNGNYLRSRQLADRCLEVWLQYFHLLIALYN